MISNLKYFSLVIGHHYLEGSNPCSKDLTYIILESHFVFSDYWWIKKLIPYGQWTKFTWCHEPINCFSSQLTDSRLKNVTDCQPNRFFKSHHSDTSHLLLPETGKIVCNNSNQKTPPMPPIHYIYESYNNPNNNEHSHFWCYHVSAIMLHQKWLTLSECVEAVFAWPRNSNTRKALNHTTTTIEHTDLRCEMTEAALPINCTFFINPLNPACMLYCPSNFYP